MTYDEARSRLEEHGQLQVLRFWEDLSERSREALLAQIETLDFDSIGKMQKLLEASEDVHVEPFGPAEVITLADDRPEDARRKGEEELRAGRVGVILVAGGQGSRLGFDGPKGSFPVGPVSGATLFEIHARKILNLENRFAGEIPFYIMTSETNDAATRSFFEENRHFGLDPSRVLFFTQGMWPALDPDGRIILDRRDHIFKSPDGHGGTLSALQDRGMIADMERRGLGTLFYFQVDNPLVEIADPEFLGLHLSNEADISVKVCAKRDPGEGLGVVVTRGGRGAIVEYTELTEAQKNERLPDGDLRFKFGSVAIHVFSFEFLKREAEAGLPLHVAHKKVPCCDATGETLKPAEPNAYKFEKFIFDAIPHAERTINVEFIREEEFSPVKNAEGKDSPATCKRDLAAKYARWIEACGVAVPQNASGEPLHAIEIDPAFASGPEELKGKLPAGFEVTGDVMLR